MFLPIGVKLFRRKSTNSLLHSLIPSQHDALEGLLLRQDDSVSENAIVTRRSEVRQSIGVCEGDLAEVDVSIHLVEVDARTGEALSELAGQGEHGLQACRCRDVRSPVGFARVLEGRSSPVR